MMNEEVLGEMVISEKKAKKMVDSLVASMAMEGMICTEDEKEIALNIVQGRVDVEDVIKDIEGKYKVNDK